MAPAAAAADAAHASDQADHLPVNIPPRLTLKLTEGPCAGEVLEPQAKDFNATVGRTKKSTLHIKDASGGPWQRSLFAIHA
jgi:hypothetical protein